MWNWLPDQGSNLRLRINRSIAEPRQIMQLATMLLRNYVEFACAKPTAAAVFAKIAEQRKATISAFPLCCIEGQQ
jgi:hypothetical protein